MRMTMFDTPVLSEVARALAWAFLKINGWHKEGEAAPVPKCVLIGAPHTSMWDVPFVLSLAFAFRTKIYFMVKDAIFIWPFRWFFYWIGGIPVDRSKSHGLVAQTIQAFKENERLIICVPPEGTRGKVRAWKTGFYHIALGAGVPISLGFLDFKRKCGGFGPLLYPTGDIVADFKILHDFYATVTAKYPELTCPPEVPADKSPGA